MKIAAFTFATWIAFGLMYRAAGFISRSGWLFSAIMAAGLGASAAFYLN
jgi:hypothetical protein